ncbi:MAG TPA: asparagine synthase (glutamine-hydrolyzing) [Terriglobales bacterium]|nr:asparagine synthase (glutamine-hydrolyzing) [Terriglobales bacterium]
MCGICGVVNWGDRETLARMTDVQWHRGPDDRGIWDHRCPDQSYVGLGSRRLAILDLSPAGHMPMCNEDRTLWITYNGEIYNFRLLREELVSKGHVFKSHSDSEVVLHLYEQEGVDCVKRLNGMFAFAVCDLRAGSPTVFLARDHFGIKPLYYLQRGHRFAFASEIKALLQLPGVEAEIDLEALHQYLTFLWVPEPKTIFGGILKLPAGHYAVLRDGQLDITEYWDMTFPKAQADFKRSETELASEIRERFRHSVESQMVSEVPIGAFLSAGLDSSSIVAMMSRACKAPVRTYTITFPQKHRVGETTLDDPSVAARLAQQLGCENHQVLAEPDVAELLPKLTWYMDEPTADPAVVLCYLVCREARKSATVLLSGVGGDELFAGYRKYCAHYWAQAYGALPATLRRSLEAAVLHLPTGRGPMKGTLRLIKKMARSASLPASERFAMNGTYLDREQKHSLYTRELSERLAACDPYVQHRARFEQMKSADFLNQMLYLDTKIFMTSLNLNYNDKMSMASSVEVRVPFLDRELAEFVAWNVPPAMKLRGLLRPTTKHIFRRAMTGILPREVLRQPKAGFAAPVDYWLVNDLGEMVDDLLSDSQFRERGLFQPAAVRNMIDEQRAGRKDWSMQVWQFLTLELWMRAFVDKSAKSQAEVSRIPQTATA